VLLFEFISCKNERSDRSYVVPCFILLIIILLNIIYYLLLLLFVAIIINIAKYLKVKQSKMIDN